MNYYIRIGELPDNEISNIYQWNDAEHSSMTAVGKEAGVSVYKAVKASGRWKIMLPENSDDSTIDTFNYLYSAVLCNRKRAYLVTGEEVGVGYDGEPVIINVKIIEDISEYIKKENKKYE